MNDKILNFPSKIPLKERIKETHYNTKHKLVELNTLYCMTYLEMIQMPKWRILSRIMLYMKCRRMCKDKIKLISHILTMEYLIMNLGDLPE